MKVSRIEKSHLIYTSCILVLAMHTESVLYAANAMQASPAVGYATAPSVRPNIIVIMTDDLDEGSFDDAVAAGLLPVLEDTFVDNGINFANSFVTNSLCCPSRTTFLTGEYTHNHGVLTNLEPYGYAAFDDTSTLATWLSQAGYRTGFIGKYLNGYDATKDLNGDGKIDNSETAYIPPGWDYWQGLVDPSTYHMWNYDILNSVTGAVEQNVDSYQTDLLARKAEYFPIHK
jgi:arylsulfatase A-like enzyme